MSRRSTLVAALAGLALTACSTGGASEPPDSGIRGLALIGPTCPVELDPPDPNCGDRPLARAIVRARRNGSTAGETRTDARGRFRLRLRPGRYRLYTSGGIGGLRTQVATARVVAHSFTRITLHVDSGIR